MSKSRVTSTTKDKPVKWPRPTPERTGEEMNRATKMPVIKVAVSGRAFE